MSSYRQFLGVNQRYWLDRLANDGSVEFSALWSSERDCLESLFRRGLASKSEAHYAITDDGRTRHEELEKRRQDNHHLRGEVFTS